MKRFLSLLFILLLFTACDSDTSTTTAITTEEPTLTSFSEYAYNYEVNGDISYLSGAGVLGTYKESKEASMDIYTNFSFKLTTKTKMDYEGNSDYEDYETTKVLYGNIISESAGYARATITKEEYTEKMNGDTSTYARECSYHAYLLITDECVEFFDLILYRTDSAKQIVEGKYKSGRMLPIVYDSRQCFYVLEKEIEVVSPTTAIYKLTEYYLRLNSNVVYVLDGETLVEGNKQVTTEDCTITQNDSSNVYTLSTESTSFNITQYGDVLRTLDANCEEFVSEEDYRVDDLINTPSLIVGDIDYAHIGIFSYNLTTGIIAGVEATRANVLVIEQSPNDILNIVFKNNDIIYVEAIKGNIFSTYLSNTIGQSIAVSTDTEFIEIYQINVELDVDYVASFIKGENCSSSTVDWEIEFYDDDFLLIGELTSPASYATFTEGEMYFMIVRIRIDTQLSDLALGEKIVGNMILFERP